MLEGSLRRAGDTVRVIVRLVDAHTGFHIWSQSYDRRGYIDLLGLPAELASEVVQSLSPSRRLPPSPSLLKRPTASPQAYRLFLAANALVGASDSNLRAAIALYDEALGLDPTFARALAARAAARLVLVSHGSVGLADLSEAERDARAALSIDADVASAHASLAHVLRARGEWLQAEAKYQTALAKSGNDPMIPGGDHIMLGSTAADARRSRRPRPPIVWRRSHCPRSCGAPWPTRSQGGMRPRFARWPSADRPARPPTPARRRS